MRAATESIRVRRAVVGDVDRLVAMLDKALAGDPFVEWVTGGDPRRARHYVDLILRKVVWRWREVYVASDLSSAALWVPPGRWQTGAFDQLRMWPGFVRAVGFRRLGAVSERLSLIERARPKEPWFLLVLLGTEPARAGEGRARATLAPVLERCDRDGVRAVVDTSLEGNKVFYERFGFRTTSCIELTPGGPCCWTMLRSPAAMDPACARAPRG